MIICIILDLKNKIQNALTSFNELIKLHFMLSSPSKGINMFPGYPLKCTYKKIQKMTSNLQMCDKKEMEQDKKRRSKIK